MPLQISHFRPKYFIQSLLFSIKKKKDAPLTVSYFYNSVSIITRGHYIECYLWCSKFT